MSFLDLLKGDQDETVEFEEKMIRYDCSFCGIPCYSPEFHIHYLKDKKLCRNCGEMIREIEYEERKKKEKLRLKRFYNKYKGGK